MIIFNYGLVVAVIALDALADELVTERPTRKHLTQILPSTTIPR